MDFVRATPTSTVDSRRHPRHGSGLSIEDEAGVVVGRLTSTGKVDGVPPM